MRGMGCGRAAVVVEWVGAALAVGGGMPSCGGGAAWIVAVVVCVAVTVGALFADGAAPGCGAGGEEEAGWEDDVGVGRAPGCGGGGPVGSGLPYDAASVVRVGGGRFWFCCACCGSESFEGG